MRPSSRTALLLSAAVLGTAALGFEPAVLRDATIETDGATIRIGAARMPLWSAAFAQQAGDVVLENVSVVQGSSTYTAPRVIFSGVNASRQDLAALFDSRTTEPLAARLSRLNARRVTAPEVVVEQRIRDGRQRASYRDLVADNIVRGRIETLAIAEGATERNGDRAGTGGHGRLTMSGLAVADLVRIYSEKATRQQPLSRVYDTFVMEDLRFRGSDGAVVRFGRLSGRDVLMRPTADSWADTMNSISGLADQGAASDDRLTGMAAALGDVFTSIEIGLMEVEDISISGPASRENTANFRFKRLAYAGASGQTPELRFEGFEMLDKASTIRFGALSFAGFSFQQTFKGLRDRPVQDLDAATLRSLIPTLGTARLQDVEVDVPNTSGSRGERSRFNLREMQLTADQPVNGIPTNIRAAVQNLGFAIPRNSTDEGLKDLAEMGYRSADLSASAALRWSQTANEILLQDLAVSGVDMFGVRASAVIGNVTRDVFDPDLDAAMVAALNATAKSLEITVDSAALVDRFLASEARKNRVPLDALKRELASSVAGTITSTLGNSPQARNLAQAVQRFMNRPSRLQVTARAKNPAGLGLQDVLNAPDFTRVLNNVDLRATAD